MPDELRAVAAVLTGQSLCRDCVVLKTGLPRWTVEDAIHRLGTMVKTSEHVTACALCRKQSVVYTLA
jgi:hypothetical protein